RLVQWNGTKSTHDRKQVFRSDRQRNVMARRGPPRRFARRERPRAVLKIGRPGQIGTPERVMTGRATRSWRASLARRRGFESNAPWNEANWKSPKFDQMLVAARSEPDDARERRSTATCRCWCMKPALLALRDSKAR